MNKPFSTVTESEINKRLHILEATQEHEITVELRRKVIE